MTKPSTNILLVCDATFESGSGHVMRQITLGAALKSVGLNPILFCFSIPDSLIARAHKLGVAVKKRIFEDTSPYLAQEIINLCPAIVVFDGYEFLYKTITEVFESDTLIMLVDDNGELSQSPCHLFLNQNLHASPEIYLGNYSRPKLLLGSRFALIRQDITQHSHKFLIRHKNKVLVAIGGTDIKSIGQKLTETMNLQRDISIVSGSGFLSTEGIDPTQFAYEMSRCTVGIIGCGTTLWEAAYLGMPSIALVVAENQMNMADSANQNELAIVIDCRKEAPFPEIFGALDLLLSNKKLRKKLSSNGTSLFDGKGAARVSQELINLLPG